MAKNRMRNVIRLLIMANLIGLAPSFVENAWANADANTPQAQNASASPDDAAPQGDEPQNDDSAQDDDFASDFSALSKIAPPDGSEEYGEIYQMRVLERSLLPSSIQDNGSHDEQNLIQQAADTMGLTPDEIFHAIG